MTTPLPRKKLPIGIQTFSEIIEEGHYYVDKTRLALDMINGGKYYFLSRPRRFGKSLFLDTLAELFEGNQKLFEGLYAQDQWDWSQSYPVIRISFGGGVLKTPADLEDKINELMLINQQALGITCSQTGTRACFAELIRTAHQQTGQRVVILVDEYDKPILDNITEPDAAREMRDGLRDLYSVIKDSDAHVKFAMLTGVSKFSKVSLFSGMNNLKDITVDARYSAICGYTDADLDRVFAPELPGLDRDEIRRWYNGYNWTGESVYNPFDALLLLDSRQFKAHWFETGTPTFLIDLLTQRGYFTPNLERHPSDLELLSSFDVDHINSDALLFQTGYLTIVETSQTLTGMWVYTLGFPNHEVRTSLNNALLRGLGVDMANTFALRQSLLPLLQANDFTGIQTLLTAFYDSIPNQWYTQNPIAQYEGYYASVFYSYFAALGLDISVEESSNAGRLDMGVKFNSQIYLFEFKVVELEPKGRALQQIKDKGYANKYQASGQTIHLIGVEFSKASRSVVGFEVESHQHS